MTERSTTRRDFLVAGAALGMTGLLSHDAWAQRRMPQRPVPSTGEMLPVIGLGSSKVVEQIAANGPEPLAAVLRALVEHGGKVVDTWPRNAENDAAFGRVVNEPYLREKLFIASKIDRTGKESGIAQFRQTQLLYGRQPLDLLQVFSLTDVDTHWPSLKDWKAAGEVRYIGVTVADARLYDRLEAFLRREQPDFVQVNYSLTERESEERMLPFAADRGVAVIINRPFMNGAYFDRLSGRALPSWTAEFECATWAQFSLKYILANPRLTCVLTETADPKHMAENALTALGPLPDEAARARMREFIDSV
jgi:diketogulonate reductase-like aldo/keto reductase